MDAALAEHLDHQVGAAVEHLRVLLELGCRVDEALEPDDAHHAIEVAELQRNRRKDVETRRSRERIALRGRELAAELALGRRSAFRERALARDEEQVPGPSAVCIVGRGIARGGQCDAQLLQLLRDLHVSLRSAGSEGIPYLASQTVCPPQSGSSARWARTAKPLFARSRRYSTGSRLA